MEIKNDETNSDSCNTFRTELSFQAETTDLEQCVNGIAYDEMNEQRRLEIIEIGTRTMKDLAVVCVTAACVLLYLVVFLALARFVFW
jgi:hypothetical protein